MRRLLLPILLLASALSAQDERMHLRFASFDPTTSRLRLPTLLSGDVGTNLWIVQFEGLPSEVGRGAIRAAGGEVHSYLPHNAYVVRMSHVVAAEVRAQRGVRATTYYHPAFRLDPSIIVELAVLRDNGVGPTFEEARYNIVVVDKRRDKPTLAERVRAIGGRIEHDHPDSILIEATLTWRQLLSLARADEVLWIDRWTPVETDMNNARNQGGANYIETQAGYTGKGITGHVYEGIEAAHQDFNATPINVLSCGTATSHGHATAGILFGNGTSHASARGMAPDAQAYYTHFGCVTTGKSRWQVVEELVKQKVMFTSAAWGNSRTRFYTSISADTDDIIFDHDMPWIQAHSNSGRTEARPQSWAKNVNSIGGLTHFDNGNPRDDSWRAGGGSTGPATDGRIKPDLVGYYDRTWTSDLTGPAGYSSGNHNANFGGTSAATPMVAGHNALALQMFTDGLLSPKRKPNGTRWENRPHFTTLRALMIANAEQYPFASTSIDNRREHVGWGFPNLKTTYDFRATHVIVDETDVLTQGTGMAYTVQVAANSLLKITMCYADPAANPSASFTRINDLSLRVTDPDGIRYWGNVGLNDGNYSVAGGNHDQRNTNECVFVRNAKVGRWIVEVLAVLVAKDSHIETPVVDADFGLVISGATFVSKTSVPVHIGSFTPFGASCPGSRASSGDGCLTLNANNSFNLNNIRADAGYAFEVVAPAGLQIAGFDIRGRTSTATSQTIATALSRPGSSGQPGAAVATGTMTVTQTFGWHRTTFAQPVNIAKDSTFFLFLQNPATSIQIADATSGTGVPYFQLINGTWSFRYPGNFNWEIRVNCTTGSMHPMLSSRDVPTLGKTLDVTLDQARTNATAVLLIGASNTTWPGGPLPFPLSGIGGGSCTLYVSPDLLVAYRTDATGHVTASLPMPSSAAVLGARGFLQFAVDDPAANALRIVMSNAADLVLGN